MNRKRGGPEAPTPDAPELLRRIDTDQAPEVRGVVGNVERRADADLEHAAGSQRHEPGSLRRLGLVSHDEIDEARQDEPVHTNMMSTKPHETRHLASGELRDG